MICLIALIVLGILSIFSVKYREYAREAFDCVFRKLTLRKCDTAFDKKVKMRVSTKIMKRNAFLGKLVYNHFEAINWFFTLMLAVSLIYSAIAVYNLAVYGNCNPSEPETCVFAQPLPSTGSTGQCADGKCLFPANDSNCDSNCTGLCKLNGSVGFGR